MKVAYEGVRARVQPLLAGFVAMILALTLALPAIARNTSAPAPVATRTVLVMGDSLSAGYGIPVAQGWVALLGGRLRSSMPGWGLVNASVSGETTAGGLSRLPRELQRVHPSVVVIELGANDGLRGLPLERMQANLDAMVRASKNAGARVLLVGMRMPPNLGRSYTEAFAGTYTRVATRGGASLLPFLLQPVALEPASFQGDHLHPTAAVQGRLLDHVWPALRPLLR